MQKREIDGEVIALAELALANSFYTAYSQLAANYQAAGLGLDEDRLAERLSTMSSLYSSQWDRLAPATLPIATKDARGQLHSKATILDALRDESAVSIELHGAEVFHWRPPIGWYFVG